MSDTPSAPHPARLEHDLVALARRGDTLAFDELVRRYRPRIHVLALHVTGDAGVAEDVAQEVLLRAFRRLCSFRAASEFYTWIHRIAVNLSVNARRSIRRRRTTSLDDPSVALAVDADARGDGGREAELHDVHRRLIAALDRLSPPLRSTVVLVALHGLTHDEAAEALGCPAGTVAWRLHEARRQLAAAFRPSGRGDEPSGAWLLAPALR
jgi:RNA polymerase sigma-70 factor (ECF subfamily)